MKNFQELERRIYSYRYAKIILALSNACRLRLFTSNCLSLGRSKIFGNPVTITAILPFTVNLSLFRFK